MTNELRVPLWEFKRAMGRFKEYGRINPYRNRRKTAAPSPEALIAFNGGFLSFEAEDLVAAIRAEGEWHGRATISVRMLGILALSPPLEDPVPIVYDGDRLQISTVSMRCDWDQDGARLVERAENPGPLDLLAMDRTVSRAEVHGTDLGKRITAAKRRVGGAITRASKLLADLEITKGELWEMVEARIRSRLEDERPESGSG